MKKFLSLVLALVMTMSLVTVSAGAKGFTDDSKIQYKEAVDVMSAAKVVDGYADGDFRPDATLTRGAAAKIICNLILGPTTAAELHADTAPFKDVPVDHTFAGYIAFCAKEGIISGYADGAFRPAATLTSYAFMKMLLGALGYDAEVEQYVGGNWSINVAKRALNIGLDDGLKGDFNGIKSVTREEACLYALNTLTADMVEYDSRTNINVGGAEVVIAGSEAKVMENKGKTDGKVFEKDGEMQFAEMYFDNLSVTKGTDDFARPANVWKNKAEKIGTYADAADATYTAKVEAGDIYKDLDLGSTVDKKDVTVYVNGEEAKDLAVAIKKGSDVQVAESDNGVLTEVFYNADDDTVIITRVDTYVGQIAKTVAAKGGKDAYVVISPEEVSPEKHGTLEFETNEEFEDDAYVLYTYSDSAKEVKSVAVAEKVTGTVNRAENEENETDGKDKVSLTIEGTRYKASANVSGQDVGEVSVKNDYTIYLDAYGYMIYVEEIEEIGDYALMLDAVKGDRHSDDKAFLVFADGTAKSVKTDEDYTDSDELGDTWTKNTPVIVTYRVDDDGVYTLRAVSETKRTVDSTTFKLTSDKAGITIDGSKKVNANSASVFVVSDPADFATFSAKDWTAYTGIKNAPTVDATIGNGDKTVDANESVSAFYYCKNNMVTIMFVVPDTAVVVEDGKGDALFVAGGSASKLIHDEDGDYYEYDAIVDGEITTVKIDRDVDGKDVEGFFKSYNTDKHGIITKLNEYNTKYTGDEDVTSVFQIGEGISKTSKEYTVTLNTAGAAGSVKNLAITVDKDADIFYVNEDHEISKSSYSGIAVDDNDLVYAVVKDYMVQTLVIQEVDDEDTDKEETKPSDEVLVVVDGTTYSISGGTVREQAKALKAKLEKLGYKDVSVEVKNNEIKEVIGYDDGIKTVFEKASDFAAAADSEALNDAIAAGKETIYLGEGAYEMAGIVENDLTIIGNGDTVIKSAKNSAETCGIYTQGALKVSGVVFEGEANGIVTVTGLNEKVEIEDCVFETENMGVYLNPGVTGGYIKNCVFKMSDKSYVAIGVDSLGEAKFEISGCTFKGQGTTGVDVETYGTNTNLKVQDSAKVNKK